jgi:uncharacterized protein (TIGR03067 family)
MGVSALVILGGLALVPADNRDDALKAELKKLQGTWVHVSTERDGVKKPEPRTLWVFEGNRAKIYFRTRPHNVDVKNWTFSPEPIDMLLTYHFKLDPTQSPKTLDQQTQYRHEKGPGTFTQVATYKLEGDTLTICYAANTDKGKRPPDFTAPKGSGRCVYVLKREKP